MKIFHTADWHLGKLVQGVYMTEDQHFVLQQFIEAIKTEKPDVVIIAGDLYDRGIPPTDAVQLFNDILNEIVLKLHTPVLAIAGNHDSPSRLDFASEMMTEKGFHLVGQLKKDAPPTVFHDQDGEVHFHLVPYCDPSTVRHLFDDETIKTHDDAMEKIVAERTKSFDPNARHVFVGHAFVTPHGEEAKNTSESERPLAIGGAEHVRASHFAPFHYTALGHLHRAHYVLHENIRYAGSPLKYSNSEATHQKGFYMVDLNGEGEVNVEKRLLKPRRDIRIIEAKMEEILTMETSEDYVFVQLTDDAPILFPMEKVRTVFPNAMHVGRVHDVTWVQTETRETKKRTELTDTELFQAFYKEVKGQDASEKEKAIFTEVLETLLKNENETEKQIETIQK